MQCRCDVCYSNAMDILYDRSGTWKWSEDGTNTKTDEGVRHRKGMLEWEYFRELKEKGNLVKCLTLRPNTLLMGPGCHRLLPGMEKYAEVAIKAARNSTHRF